MKNKYLLLLMVLGCSYGLNAQIHNLTLNSNQDAQLVASAGGDVNETQGTVVTIGDTISVATGGSSPYMYAWSPSTGLNDPAIANPDVTVGSADQTYTLTVTDSKNCTDTDEMEVTVKGLSILELPQGQIQVFPIPSEGEIMIENSTGLDQLEVSITDLSGKLINASKVGTGLNMIDLTGAQAGMYTVSIQSEGKIYNSTIVIR